MVYAIHENKLTLSVCTILQKPCITIKGSSQGVQHLEKFH